MCLTLLPTVYSNFVCVDEQRSSPHVRDITRSCHFPFALSKKNQTAKKNCTDHSFQRGKNKMHDRQVLTILLIDSLRVLPVTYGCFPPTLTVHQHGLNTYRAAQKFTKRVQLLHCATFQLLGTKPNDMFKYHLLRQTRFCCGPLERTTCTSTTTILEQLELPLRVPRHLTFLRKTPTMTFYLTFLSGILSGISFDNFFGHFTVSSVVHCDEQLAVELRRCPL